jgi:hypothetical protein
MGIGISQSAMNQTEMIEINNRYATSAEAEYSGTEL